MICGYKGVLMGKLFGTDGIRGIADQYPITEEMGIKLGRAVVQFCIKRDLNASVVIGRDTRISGEMLADAVSEGVQSVGGKALRSGVIPTPGVAFLARDLGAGAGIVLSASHNPQEYNGFKIFSGKGYKLSEEEESEIEELIMEDIDPGQDSSAGSVLHIENEISKYIEFIKGTFPEISDPREMKMVIDCSNGAASGVAPDIFKGLGFDIEVMFAEPDGKNINLNCGSQHTEALSRRVKDLSADMGLAFDGDADRLIAVDEKGDVLTGDQILAICAKMLSDQGTLKNNLVVSTVMSNMGLKPALKAMGVEHISTRVGDRHVMEEMRKRDCSLGGEESGHLIFADQHTTGDGIIAALQLVYAKINSGKTMSELASLMTIYPQILINVKVESKPDIFGVSELVRVIKEAEQGLGEDGRVLVRYSGTEPLCRVMAEGKVKEDIEKYAQQIADIISEQLN